MPDNKILVIRGGAIGDFILTLPVLAALRRQFPQARLEVLGYPHIARLALAGGLADDVRPIESRALAGFFAREGELDQTLQSYFESFAVIVSFLYDPDRIFQANIARCSRAQFIVGPYRPDDTAGLHATEALLKPLERLAIFDADSVPRLALNSQLPALNQLALHPGSGSERKNWPEANWAELLQRLAAETSLQFLLIGGEAESDRLPRLAQVLPAGRCETLASQPLVEVARRLSLCAGFVGHDSGITHLAAALGVPTLALWGPTPEAVWAPRGERVTILRAPQGPASKSPTEVLSQLRRLLPRMDSV
ncbi:MAG TPA: glycosyltransferase family 9 protein [Verrucomicrobiae bacterium]|nr:glycosyltransferase family 9 protein [Verrucomicrobiae bacterium]